MTGSRPLIEQVDLQKSAQLPTMYDLPSEDPEEPGDEFHDLQPQLLSATLRLTDVSSNRIFTGTDLNLYYDPQHVLWHKRPDWFVAIGVPRLYAESDLRLSYVVADRMAERLRALGIDPNQV
jgi:Uma2 family endonuclease